ncbi:hypothetical protein ACFSCV_01685 [Methylopila henanensis]|uniref:DNA-binding protein n=1 Tax=Methylopila henanensis TaxID=873516 RepID=A0ABW4K0U3_9HYPH
MTNNQDKPLGEILTLAEAAAKLKIGTRALIAAAGRAKRGSRFGREWRFTEADLAAIMEAMRVEPSRHHGSLPSLSTSDASAKLQALATARLQKRLESRRRRG